MTDAPDIRLDLTFGTAAGTALLGDFYGPGTPGAPVVIAIHGGAWKLGSKSFYSYWGHFLSTRGYALFAVDYRLAAAGKYPAAVSDVRQAIRYVQDHADALGIDGTRIALMGDSAGAHLAALVALTDRLPGEVLDDSELPRKAGIKAAILFYGVFDMLAQWRHDQLARPLDSITEKFLGIPPMKNRRLYFEASPISHVEEDSRDIGFLVTYGTKDNVVDHATQSESFVATLTESGKFVRTIIVPFAPHFWSADPIEEEGSYPGIVAPRLLRFLKDRL